MKKISLLKGLIGIPLSGAIAASLASCSCFQKKEEEKEQEHIVQPSTEQKTKTPDKGVLKVIYNITLKEVPTETVTATITDEAIITNGSNFKTPVVEVSGKVVNVTVEWATKPEENKSCTFSIELKTSKWTNTITGCSIKYTAPEPEPEPEPEPVKAVKIAGSHNVDIADTVLHKVKYVITDQRNEDITSACSFKVEDNFETDPTKKSIGTIDSNGILTLNSQGTSNICTATITVTHNETGIYNSFDIEIANFNKLKVDDEYGLVNGYATCSDDATGNVILPTRYFNDDTIVPITQIVSSGMNNAGITWVYISKSINDIGQQAFGTGLNYIDVDIGNGTYSCPEGSNCITKGTELLFGCKNTVIPTTGITTIASHAFYNSGITDIEIPQNITQIGDYAFAWCSNLTTVTFTGTPTLNLIGENAFYNSGLSSIEIPQNVAEIKTNTFASCSNLSSVTFGGTPTVNSIASDAFNGCSSLQSITFPSSIETIAPNAFKDSGLTSATFEAPSARWIQTNDTTNKYLVDVSSPTNNAANLTDCTTEGIAITNWGKTGINVNPDGVKTAHIIYTGFNETEDIQLRDSECTKQIFDTTTATGKISFNYDYLDANTYVTGTVKVTGKSGVIYTSEEHKEFSSVHQAIEIDLSSKWDQISSQETLTVSLEVDTVAITIVNNYPNPNFTVYDEGTSKTISNQKSQGKDLRTIWVHYNNQMGGEKGASWKLVTPDGGTVVKTWGSAIKVGEKTFDFNLSQSELVPIFKYKALNFVIEAP